MERTNSHKDNSGSNESATGGQPFSSCCGAILFVGHGASCLGLASAFGAPQQYIGYCSLTHFQQTTSNDDETCDDGNNDNDRQWQLVEELGSVSHLSDPQTSLDSAW